MSCIRIGTASWTDKTLLASGWYPDDAKSAEERLAYYASQFPIVEVDSTYYTPPNERNSELWAQRTPPGFTFNVKAYSLLTQHPTRTASLYKDLRPEPTQGQRLREGPRPEGRRPGLGAVPGRAGSAAPGRQAGRAAVPVPAVVPDRAAATRSTCWSASERSTPCRSASSSATRPGCRTRTARRRSTSSLVRGAVRVRGHAAGAHVVDPAGVAATADLAVVRFHGHSDKWTSKDIYDRFGYHYSSAELKDWAPKVAQLAEQARRPTSS